MQNSINQKIRERISDIPKGEIFGYEKFQLVNGKELAVAKALSRLVKEGKLRRVSKGKYYKPKQTKFGEKRPGEAEILKIYLKDGAKTIAYITGASLYNRMGISTQVPYVIEVATENPVPDREIEGYKIRFVKSRAPITKSRIPYLEILDVLKNIDRIPGTGANEALKRLLIKITSLAQKDLDKLSNLAFEYNPATRALLGAVLEYYCKDFNNSAKLRKTLSPYSTYRFNLDDHSLPNKSKWRIK